MSSVPAGLRSVKRPVGGFPPELLAEIAKSGRRFGEERKAADPAGFLRMVHSPGNQLVMELADSLARAKAIVNRFLEEHGQRCKCAYCDWQGDDGVTYLDAIAFRWALEQILDPIESELIRPQPEWLVGRG